VEIGERLAGLIGIEDVPFVVGEGVVEAHDRTVGDLH
jgi:hypothetical protein